MMKKSQVLEHVPVIMRRHESPRAALIRTMLEDQMDVNEFIMRGVNTPVSRVVLSQDGTWQVLDKAA